MKFFIKIVLLTIAFGTLYAQQYWIRIPSPTTKWFYSVSFTDTINGWIAGDSGIIIHTSNGGINWSIQNSGINYHISYITFLNQRLGSGIANDFLYHGTTILKTTNGGINWSSSNFSDTSVILETIYWKDSISGFLAGQYGKIFRTSNGGINWISCSVDSGEYSDRTIYKFKFITAQTGFACGGIFDGGGVIWNTTNSGLNWHSTHVCIEPIFDMLFINSNTAVGTGGDYEYGVEIIRTVDTGNYWNYIPLQMFGYGSSISARTNYELWVAAGYGAHFERSLDTGNTFKAINIPDTSGIQAIQFIDSLHGWAAGSNSSIYKFNKNVIGVQNQGNKVPVVFKLEQNYPNPFNPSTTIKFTLPGLSKGDGWSVRLDVYDLQGREVESLIPPSWGGKDGLDAGTYQAEFDGTNYSSGVYFYRLLAKSGSGEFVESKKMLLIK